MDVLRGIIVGKKYRSSSSGKTVRGIIIAKHSFDGIDMKKLTICDNTN